MSSVAVNYGDKFSTALPRAPREYAQKAVVLDVRMYDAQTLVVIAIDDAIAAMPLMNRDTLQRLVCGRPLSTRRRSAIGHFGRYRAMPRKERY